MSGLEKRKQRFVEHTKIIKTIILILCSPFCLMILNLLLSTLFQLGIYTGTFLRFLYSIVVY